MAGRPSHAATISSSGGTFSGRGAGMIPATRPLSRFPNSWGSNARCGRGVRRRNNSLAASAPLEGSLQCLYSMLHHFANLSPCPTEERLGISSPHSVLTAGDRALYAGRKASSSRRVRLQGSPAPKGFASAPAEALPPNPPIWRLSQRSQQPRCYPLLP